jgi:hypothetical protein
MTQVLQIKKRFIAVLYPNEIQRRFQVQKLIISAVEELKKVENFGSSKDKVKHGKMDADIVFLSIYKKDDRRGKHKGQFAENDNFIGLVQYDVDKHFNIQDIPMRGRLHKQRIGNFEFCWNPNFK